MIVMVVVNPAVLRPLVMRRLRAEGYTSDIIPEEVIDHAAQKYFDGEVNNPTTENIPSADEVVDNICNTFYRELKRVVSTGQIR